MERRRVYQLGWTVFFGLLITVTWPLWVPIDRFPAVPLVSVVIPVYYPVSIMALLSSVAGLVLQWLPDVRWQRWGLMLLGVGLVVSFLLDQHRIQAWAYQFLAITIFMLAGTYETPEGSSPRQRFRWLVVSIYLYSCWSKLDASFLGSVGPQMLMGLLDKVGIELKDPWSVRWLILLLPISEGAIGVGLLSGWRPRMFVVLAMVMHLGLMLLLGPMGWHHQWGVIVWNAFFVFQAWALFWPSDDSEVEGKTVSPGHWISGVANAWMWFVLLFPLTEAMGYCDHWLAWELYAPRTSRVQVFLPAMDREQLPESIWPFLKEADPSGWQELDLAAWSLNQQHAPIYPEDRFQFGVALSLRQWLKQERSLRVLWRSAANRWTGQRDDKWLSGFDAVQRQADQFRWNTHPVGL